MSFHGTKILLQMVSHDLWAWNFWPVCDVPFFLGVVDRYHASNNGLFSLCLEITII